MYALGNLKPYICFMRVRMKIMYGGILLPLCYTRLMNRVNLQVCVMVAFYYCFIIQA